MGGAERSRAWELSWGRSKGEAPPFRGAKDEERVLGSGKGNDINRNKKGTLT